MERWELGGGEIRLGRGMPETLEPGEHTAFAILTQAPIQEYAGAVAHRLASRGATVHIHTVPDRDEAKTLAVAESVYEWMSGIGLRRDGTVVGIGGGAVTDLAGFVAATYLRGVDAVYMPTTLLGAVDAAIGGKSGVNVAGKNLVGAFRHPALVAVDLDVLAALPDHLIAEGMAEAIKTGAIADPELLELASEPRSNLAEIVSRCITAKVTVVRDDFRESEQRMILNFGHTLGHGIEMAAEMTHGEAISVGMVAAAQLSSDVLGFAEGDRLVSVLEGVDLPTSAAGTPLQDVLELVKRDKKADAEGLRMVLLRSFGSPVVVRVDDAQIQAGLEAVGIA